MPLRDHLHPPLADYASWEELHGAWSVTIAFRSNAILPPEYRSGVRVRLGTAVEIDVATFQEDCRPELVADRRRGQIGS